jgi:hypothetical protein
MNLCPLTLRRRKKASAFSAGKLPRIGGITMAKQGNANAKRVCGKVGPNVSVAVLGRLGLT